MNYKLICGDSLEKLKKFPDNSIDCCVSDIPSSINFMSKDWDKDRGGRTQWCSWLTSIFDEVYRTMKPGSYGLIWALPRRSHWASIALEDSGFIIRDKILHCFGSGFPKSYNIGKNIDDPQWNGWGTGLKPAYEEWIMIQKPISEKTIVDNVLRWGTGGINIDGCRIGTEEITSHGHIGDKYAKFKGGEQKEKTEDTTHIGRFPANFIHDGSEEVMAEFEKAGINKSGYNPKAKPKQYKGGTFGGGFVPSNYESGYGDTGTPARFFYNTSSNTCPICEYNIENNHTDIWEKLQSYANNVETNSQITKAITELIAQKNVIINQNKLFVQDVKFATNLCENCLMSIVVVLVGLRMGYIVEKELHHILDYITESKRCILIQSLVLIVKIWENIDTILTTQIHSTLFGYVKVVITNYIQEIEKIELSNYPSTKMDSQKNKEQDYKSRFVYVSKPSTKERNMGCDELKEVDKPKDYDGFTNHPRPSTQDKVKNNHPTIKSVKLMAYLITLITPPTPNAIILDPFTGSGTTGISALLLGHKFIGIELSEEYIKIAETRIKAYEKYRQFLK